MSKWFNDEAHNRRPGLQDTHLKEYLSCLTPAELLKKTGVLLNLSLAAEKDMRSKRMHLIYSLCKGILDISIFLLCVWQQLTAVTQLTAM